MTYYQELGEISPDAWCSSNTPPKAGCNPVSGLCMPMDSSTLSIFKDLQRAINRLLAVQGASWIDDVSGGSPLIDVDGRLGPATVKALNSVANLNMNGCDDIAANVPDILLMVVGLANEANAPVVPDPVPKTPPSMPGPSGTVIHPPPDIIKNSALEQGFSAALKSPLGIAAVVVAGLLLWRMTSSIKKNPARRRARRRR